MSPAEYPAFPERRDDLFDDPDEEIEECPLCGYPIDEGNHGEGVCVELDAREYDQAAYDLHADACLERTR